MYKSWQDPCGNWLCNDLNNLGNEKSDWWYPARKKGIPLTDFLLLLCTQYKAQHVQLYEESGFLYYTFKTKKDADAFCKWVNSN